MHTDVDVIIAGAGPTGLMLACELRLAGASVVVLERRPELRQTPKANGINGRIVDLLRMRGLLDRIEAECNGTIARSPGAPFGNFYLNFARLEQSPLWGAHIAQPRLEYVLEVRARELGAEIRRGHEVIGVEQDQTSVTAGIRTDGGACRLRARYLVGCDGAGSVVRNAAGIAFPGMTYPEINRLGTATMHASVTKLANGDLEVPGFGRVPAGFTRTPRGVFAQGSMTPGMIGIQTTEYDATEAVGDAPLTLDEFRASIRRVLGGDIPLGDVTRLSRYGLEARLAESYRNGRIFVAGDAAHQFPATGSGINVGMLDAANLGWKLGAAIAGRAPAGLLDTYHDERHGAGARNMIQTQAQAALRRDDDPAIAALRAVLDELMAYDEPLQHMGNLIAGNDVRYSFPNPNGHQLTGTFVCDAAIALPMHDARPAFLDLASRTDLSAVAHEWSVDVELRFVEPEGRVADALLIRPDGFIAWAAAVDEPGENAKNALRLALCAWLGDRVAADPEH